MRLVVMNGATLTLDGNINVEDFDFQAGSTIDGPGGVITVTSETADYCGICAGVIDPATDLDIMVDQPNDWNLRIMGQSGYVNDIEVDGGIGALYLTDGPNHRIKGDLIMNDTAQVLFENVGDTFRVAAIYGPTGIGEDCVLGTVADTGIITVEHNIWGSIDWREDATRITRTAGEGNTGRVDASGFVGGTYLHNFRVYPTDTMEITNTEFDTLRVDLGAFLKRDPITMDILINEDLYLRGAIINDPGDAELNITFVGNTTAYYDPSAGKVHDIYYNSNGATCDFSAYTTISGKLLTDLGTFTILGQDWAFGYAEIEINDTLVYGASVFDTDIDYLKGVGGDVSVAAGKILVSAGDAELNGVDIPDNTVPGNWIDTLGAGAQWIVGDICMWIGGAGDWSDTSHWIPPIVPAAAIIVLFNSGSGEGRVVVDVDTNEVAGILDTGSEIVLVGDDEHYLNVGTGVHVRLGRGGKPNMDANFLIG